MVVVLVLGGSTKNVVVTAARGGMLNGRRMKSTVTATTGTAATKTTTRTASSTAAGVSNGMKNAVTATATGTVSKPKNIKQLVKIYSQLGKARLSTLVVASAGCGFLLAGAPVDPVGLMAVIGGVTLQSYAANTANQIYEVKTDALMKRTRARPLPSKRISKSHAAAFATVNAVAGTSILATFCNPMSATLGVATILLYSGVYTPLKQHSVFNTHVGAVVGAIPPLIGYSAATGTLSVEAGILAAALYGWQFNHFWALAWMYKADYAAGNHKMLPSIDPTGSITGKAIWRYSVALSSLPLASYSLGITGVMFPIESIAFNGWMLYQAYKFKENPNTGNARKVFRASLMYLPIFMGLMIFHKKGWTDDEQGLFRVAPPCLSPSTLTSSSSSSSSSTTSAAVSGSASTKSNMGMSHETQNQGRLEASLVQAKTFMKSICIHEYLVKPPLTRAPPVPITSSSTLTFESETNDNNAEMCPVKSIR